MTGIMSMHSSGEPNFDLLLQTLVSLFEIIIVCVGVCLDGLYSCF